MPVVAGAKSRFSVLRIEDDEESEEESQPQQTMLPPKKGPKKKSKRKNKQGTTFDHDEPNMIVQTPTDEQLDVELQEAMFKSQLEFDHQQRIKQHEQERVDAALRESVQSAQHSNSTGSHPKSTSSTSVERKQPQATSDQGDDKDGVKVDSGRPKELVEADEEANAIIQKGTGQVQVRERKLIAVYRARLKTTLNERIKITDELKLYQEESKKYRDRYRKVCELLKESEVKEKAKLLVELERSRKNQTDLTEQITELSGQLEQAKSKIHELENAARKMTAT